MATVGVKGFIVCGVCGVTCWCRVFSLSARNVRHQLFRGLFVRARRPVRPCDWSVSLPGGLDRCPLSRDLPARPVRAQLLIVMSLPQRRVVWRHHRLLWLRGWLVRRALPARSVYYYVLFIMFFVYYFLFFILNSYFLFYFYLFCLFHLFYFIFILFILFVYFFIFYFILFLFFILFIYFIYFLFNF